MNPERLLIKELEKRCEILEKQIQKKSNHIKTLNIHLQTLISESTGVAGLHFNGDIAPWEELMEGGRFEEWLLPFSVESPE